MDTVALCPLAVGSVLWQPDASGWTLTAVVKASFTLEHNKEPVLADVQDPVGEDRWFADDRRFSLAAASDLVPFKPRVDVTLVGHAYAPSQKPVDALVATLCVGDLEKSVGLVGDRVWAPGPDGLEPAAPLPFVKMPLRWERAARGPDNPVGLDLTAPPVGGALALPNLEPVDDDEGSGLAVGFGPIAPTWPSRRARLAAGHAAWAERMCGPAPPGFDFGYFNAAPPDQQIDVLRYGSRIVLSHLHPRVARLETKVPTLRPKAFFVHAHTGKAEELSLRCDTLAIDTDRAVLTLVWRGLCSVATGALADLGTLVVAIETKGKEIRYKQIEALVRQGDLSSIGLDDLATDERNPMGIRHDSVKPGGPAPPTLPGRAPLDPPGRKRRTSSAELHAAGSRKSSPADSSRSGEGAGVGERSSDASNEPKPIGAGEPAPHESAGPREAAERAKESVPACAASVMRASTYTATEVNAQMFDEGTDASTQDEGIAGGGAGKPAVPLSTWARIAVALERGDASALLERLGLSRDDVAAIRADWTRRAEEDREVAAALAEAMEAARWE